MRGFEAAAGLVQGRIRKAGESRGFAASRVLTHWAEIVGPETSAICRPVRISYRKGGLGATLIVLTSGAHAPLLQMQLPQLRERVNAVYGYNAISRITLTQSAAEGLETNGQRGFAEPAAGFDHAPASPPRDPGLRRTAEEVAVGVRDTDLRSALEDLAQNVLARAEQMKGR